MLSIALLIEKKKEYPIKQNPKSFVSKREGSKKYMVGKSEKVKKGKQKEETRTQR